MGDDINPFARSAYEERSQRELKPRFQTYFSEFARGEREGLKRRELGASQYSSVVV